MWRFEKRNLPKVSGFTLVELLLVTGILAILASVTVLILNPLEMLRGGRDSIRLNDLSSLNTALGIFSVNKSGSFMGAGNTVYISIPYSSPDCGYGSGNPLNLSPIPFGWSYVCRTEADYKKNDSSGWIPINFSSISYGAPLSVLPIDPINSDSQYYTYVTGGSWELTALLESEKYKQQAVTDGGQDPTMYEYGSNLTLSPFVRGLAGYWRFNSNFNDSSGNNNNGTQFGGVSFTTGKQAQAGSFNGVDAYVDTGNSSSLNLINAITIEMWVKPTAIQEICYPGSGNDGNVGIAAKVENNVGSTTWSWQLRYGSLDSCRLGIQLNTVNYGAQWATAKQDLTSNEWHHIAFTFDGSVIKFYVNSALKDTNTLAGQTTIISNLNKLLIASDGWSEYTGYFNGLIDEFRIYNRALSSAEISAIYNITK